MTTTFLLLCRGCFVFDQQGAQPFVIGGTDEAFFELGGESFGLADLCQSPTVASFFKPYDNSLSPYTWLVQNAIMSYAYR